MSQRVPIDPEKGLTDLVRQLGDDSKRLLGDEVRLAKLETHESLRRVRNGALWLAAAFAVGVVALVALTLFGATAIAAVARGHVWAGAVGIAAVEIAIGLWLVRRGLGQFKRAPHSLPETRAGLRAIRGS